jgi:hypothetical protein
MADSDSGGGGIFGGGGIIGILVFLWFTGALDGFLGNDDKEKDVSKKEVDQQIAEVEAKIEIKTEELKKEVVKKPQPVAGPQGQRPSRRWVTTLRDSNGKIARIAFSMTRPRISSFNNRTEIKASFVGNGEHFKAILVPKGHTYTFKRE